MAILGAAALVLVLVGAGCRNPFRKKPGEVLARAQDRWAEAAGVHVNAHLALDLDIPGKGATSDRGHVELTVVSSASGKTPEEARADAVTTLEINAAEISGKLVLAQRVIGQTVYLQLQDLVVTPKGTDARSQTQIDAVLGAVKGVIGGKWIKIDPQEIANLAGQLGAGQVKIPTADELRARQEIIRDAIRKHPLLLVREDLGDDRVGDVSTYHYRVGISRDAIGALITTLATQFGVPSAQVEEAQHALQDPVVAARMDGVAGEAWISKKEQDILRLAVPIDIGEANGSKAAGNIVVEFSDWGKPVTVDAPTDVKTIQELLGGFLGGGGLGGLGVGSPPSATGTPGSAPELLPGATPGTPQSGTGAPTSALPLNVGGPINTPQVQFKIGIGPDSDGDGLSDSEEARYGSDPHQADTDHDGFLDGVEVQRGYNPTGPGRLPGVRR